MNRLRIRPYPPTQNTFGDIFSELMNSFSSMENSDIKSYTQPAVNIIEEKEKFLLDIIVPGIDKDNISIDIDKDELIISSNFEEKEENTEENYIKREYRFSAFKRVFTIPKSIDKNSIDAEYNNGILTISLKKREEEIDKGPISVKIK